MNQLMSRLAIGVALAVGLYVAAPATAAEGQRYAVTITNVTRGQVITPPVVMSHTEDFRLFTPGAPAIAELVTLAEEGAVDPLLDVLATRPEVFEARAAGDVLMPGASVTIEIMAPGTYRHVTAVGMLATTNDAFFAVRGVEAPRRGERSVGAVAYDAGSEANSELCAFIPGPPCGSAGARDTAAAEGYVHVHAGIHGGGDLVPGQHDWRNPVAEIIIRRLE
ncbi:spondin domain-containing protein [bacterium]|nr:spondin domain-containing protein [bacterium]